MRQRGFSTRAVHESGTRKDGFRALRFPVYDCVAFDFESAETMANTFFGRRPDFAYSRIANPTVEIFENKITALEDGLGTVAVSSGMAAISTAVFNLVGKGDNIVSASSLFGGTYSFFTNVLKTVGIEPRFVASDNLKAFEAAIDDHTRLIFLETISNPCIVVPDFHAISEIAKRRGVPIIADSTVTTPYLFDGKTFGANIIVHSTTKYISGGATSMGGAIVDLGNFDWSSIPSLKNYHRFNEQAFVARLRREVYRETGGCLSPHNAYLQALGLETLVLRMERICRNAQAIAEFLQDRGEVRDISYSGLPSSSYHGLAARQFKGMHGGVLSFRLATKAAAYTFLNRLSLVKRATNLGDNRSLAIHPASTIFANIPEEEVAALGVDDTLIRLSVGIEDVDDLISDITEALKGT